MYVCVYICVCSLCTSASFCSVQSSSVMSRAREGRRVHKVQIRKKKVSYVMIGAGDDPNRVCTHSAGLAVASIRDKSKLQQWATLICARATETSASSAQPFKTPESCCIAHFVLC